MLETATRRQWLSPDDAAEVIGCTPLTIRRAISQGRLKAYRFGRLIRIKPADLDKAMRPVTNAADLRGGDADVA